MRPLLRPSTHFAWTGSDIFFEGIQASFSIKVPRIAYDLFERISPFLDGCMDLSEICVGLPNESYRVIQYVVKALINKGLILDISKLTTEIEKGSLKEEQLAIVTYLESVSDQPYKAYMDIQKAKVLITGDGNLSNKVYKSLLSLGISNVHNIQFCNENQNKYIRETDLTLIVFDQLTQENVQQFDKILANRKLCVGFLGQLGIVGPLYDNANSFSMHKMITRISSRTNIKYSHSDTASSLLCGLAAIECFNLIGNFQSSLEENQALIVENSSLNTYLAKIPFEANSNNVNLAKNIFLTSGEKESKSEILDPNSRLCDKWFGLLTEEIKSSSETQTPIFRSKVRIYLPNNKEDLVYGIGSNVEKSRENAFFNGLRNVCCIKSPNNLEMENVTIRNKLIMKTDELVVGVGNTYMEWVADGLARLLGKRVLAGELQLVDSTLLSFLNIQDEWCRFLWKFIVIRLGVSIRAKIYKWKSTNSPNVCVVTSDNGNILGCGYGLKELSSTISALEAAIFTLQVENTDIYKQEHNLFLNGLIELKNQNNFKDFINEFSEQGFQIMLHPWFEEPTIYLEGFIIGWVGIEGG